MTVFGNHPDVNRSMLMQAFTKPAEQLVFWAPTSRSELAGLKQEH